MSVLTGVLEGTTVEEHVVPIEGWVFSWAEDTDDVLAAVLELM